MAVRLLIFGAGYCGRAIAAAAHARGERTIIASREPRAVSVARGIEVVHFERAGAAIAEATHLVATAPPSAAGDPVLARHENAIAASGEVRWIGYLSATGVYGDRGGESVDEDTEPGPTSERGRWRLAAEDAWRRVAQARPLDLFRLGGVYGPGRSVLGALRAGRARRIEKPGHLFARIHIEDIVAAVNAAMARPADGARVLNLVDDEPASSASVLEEAARLLGIAPPPALPFGEASATMGSLELGFWGEERRVESRKTQALLGRGWRYPSYREGLRAILLKEAGQGRGEK